MNSEMENDDVDEQEQGYTRLLQAIHDDTLSRQAHCYLMGRHCEDVSSGVLVDKYVERYGIIRSLHSEDEENRLRQVDEYVVEECQSVHESSDDIATSNVIMKHLQGQTAKLAVMVAELKDMQEEFPPLRALQQGLECAAAMDREISTAQAALSVGELQVTLVAAQNIQQHFHDIHPYVTAARATTSNRPSSTIWTLVEGVEVHPWYTTVRAPSLKTQS